jgi:predicted RNase H-like nuclease
MNGEDPRCPPGIRFAGVDLAWGQRADTGLAVADAGGRLLAATQVRTDAEILAWLAPVTAGPCVVAFDAPLIVRNPAGSRACDRLMGRYFGAAGASCYPVSTASPLFAAGPRALRLSRELGLETGPASAAPRRAIEVYPHAAIVALFGLQSVLRYKPRPGRDLELLRSELLRLVTLLESLATRPVPLHVQACPDWPRIREAVASAPSKAALGRVEDTIDAVVCAAVAQLAAVSPAAVRVLGTAADGYIVTPVTPALAARIDAGGASGECRELGSAPARRAGRAGPGAPPPQR